MLIFIIFFSLTNFIYSSGLVFAETNPTGLFLTEKEMTLLGFKLSAENIPQLKRVWRNRDKRALIIRLEETRWVFTDEEKAKVFFAKFNRKVVDEARQIFLHSCKLGDQTQVFVKKGEDKSIKNFGSRGNIFYFVFRQGRVMAKIVTAGSEKLQLFQAVKLAELAAQQVKKWLAKK